MRTGSWQLPVLPKRLYRILSQVCYTHVTVMLQFFLKIQLVIVDGPTNQPQYTQFLASCMRSPRKKVPPSVVNDDTRPRENKAFSKISQRKIHDLSHWESVNVSSRSPLTRGLQSERAQVNNAHLCVYVARQRRGKSTTAFFTLQLSDSICY